MYRPKVCIDCGSVYVPTAPAQLRCSSCGIERKKQVGREEARKHRAHRTQKRREEDNRKSADYHTVNKEEINKKVRDRNRIIRLEVLIHYSQDPPSCACCGETHIEFLELDHPNGDGAEQRRITGARGGPDYYRVRKEGYIQKRRVLCSNCNQSMGKYGYCPHQLEKGGKETDDKESTW
jgi:hypothetical protein